MVEFRQLLQSSQPQLEQLKAVALPMSTNFATSSPTTPGSGAGASLSSASNGTAQGRSISIKDLKAYTEATTASPSKPSHSLMDDASQQQQPLQQPTIDTKSISPEALRLIILRLERMCDRVDVLTCERKYPEAIKLWLEACAFALTSAPSPLFSTLSVAAPAVTTKIRQMALTTLPGATNSATTTTQPTATSAAASQYLRRGDSLQKYNVQMIEDAVGRRYETLASAILSELRNPSISAEVGVRLSRHLIALGLEKAVRHRHLIITKQSTHSLTRSLGTVGT